MIGRCPHNHISTSPHFPLPTHTDACMPWRQVNSFGSGAQAVVVFLLLPGLAALRGISPGHLTQVGSAARSGQRSRSACRCMRVDRCGLSLARSTCRRAPPACAASRRPARATAASRPCWRPATSPATWASTSARSRCCALQVRCVLCLLEVVCSAFLHDDSARAGGQLERVLWASCETRPAAIADCGMP